MINSSAIPEELTHSSAIPAESLDSRQNLWGTEKYCKSGLKKYKQKSILFIPPQIPPESGNSDGFCQNRPEFREFCRNPSEFTGINRNS